MTYEEVIKNLFSVLAVCNASDSDEAQDWQHTDDSSYRVGAYGDIQKAIIKLAGEEIVDHWAETNEIEICLADRNRHMIIEPQPEWIRPAFHNGAWYGYCDPEQVGIICPFGDQYKPACVNDTWYWVKNDRKRSKTNN